MSTLDDLLDACVANPDDDEPRLVWADAVGGERGELVVIQCRLAREQLPLREAIALRRRQRELLANHGAEWSQLVGRARQVSFRRGFVDAAELHSDVLLEQEDAIVEAAPLLDSALVDIFPETRDGHIDRLAAVLARLRLRGLELFGVFNRDGQYGDELARLLERSGASDRLRAFGLGTDDAPGLRSIGTARHVQRLWLDDELAVDQLEVILAMPFDALRALDIRTRSVDALGRLAPQIPKTVTELRFGQILDGELAGLVGSPIAPTLERLAIECGTLVHDTRLFARFPRLRALTFHNLVDFGAGTAAAALRTFASLRLPALRELAITAPIDANETLRIAEAFGPQLELLDLRNNHHALRHVNAIKRLVAGEVLVEYPMRQQREEGLLRVGPTTQMPWWDHVTLS